MQIRVWRNFSKRYNSTKRAQGGTVVNVNLKEPTSKESPSFTLSADYDDVNYIKWGDHYYYVNNVMRVTNDLIQIDCKQDLLATFKTDIMNTTAFIQYSSSDYNEHIADNRVTQLNSSTTYHYSQTASLFDTTGYYVLTTVSNDVHTGGFATFYVLTASEVEGVANELMNANDSALEALAKRFTSPYDAIISCKWIPLSHSYITSNRCTATNNVVLGNFGTAKSGYRVSNTSVIEASTQITFAMTPDFRGNEPFTKLRAYFPYYSTFEIPTISFNNTVENTIQFYASMDFITGDISFNILNDDNEILSTINYNCAVEIPVGQIATNNDSILSVLGSATTGAISIASTGGLASVGAVASAVSSVNGITDALKTMPSVRGSSGGRSFNGLGNKVVLMIERLKTTEPYNLRLLYGLPCNEVKQIGSLSGYCQTVGASVDCDAYGDDKIAINSMLDAGFYIE